jgi:aspartyl/asparaginyl-tRNA synthetase
VGPAFRAESTVTNRHATEFTALDVEASWIESPDELMDLEEDLLRHALGVSRDVHGDEVEDVFGVPVEVPEAPIPRLAADAGSPALRRSGGRLTHQAEQALCKQARATSGHSFVFITGYPAGDRPFYTMQDADHRTRSFDLLWGGMEVSSGCQREHRHDRLRAQATAAGLESEAMTRFLDACWFPMFRHGCPPHGCFGLGLDRLLMAATGSAGIRDASFVPRLPGRLTP